MKRNWIDFNASVVIDGTAFLDQAARDLMNLVLKTASDKQTPLKKKASERFRSSTTAWYSEYFFNAFKPSKNGRELSSLPFFIFSHFLISLWLLQRFRHLL